MTNPLNISLNQQIDWLNGQLKWMRKQLPDAVAQGHITEEVATHKLSCAQAAVCTLTQLRGIVGGKGAAG